MEGLPNYTGPYISDGKIQESVEFGSTEPRDQLDAYSRLHDSAYAHWDDFYHRTAADALYKEQSSRLAGHTAALAGGAVSYGNYTARAFSNLLDKVQYGFLGLVVGGIQNTYRLAKYESNKDSLIKEIKQYYDTDPYKQFQNVSIPYIPAETINREGGVEVIKEEMANKNNKTQKKNKNKSNNNAQKKRAQVVNKSAKSRAVSMMTAAPVSIGNTVRGSSPSISNTGNGARVVGRDFMFSPIGTSSISNWTLVGGTPLTPAAFVDSGVRSMFQVYNQFKINRIAVHYITSSSTSSTGDVMFYFSKNRNAVFLNQTSANLLPFVLSDENTVMGPQWTNHTAVIRPSNEWKSCDYGMDATVNDYSDGEIFLLSKTTTTDAPGYVIFDYDIEFKEHSIIPRLNAFPLSRIQWYQLEVGISATAVAAGAVVGLATAVGTVATNISGVTSSNPTGITNGDLYKVIVDITNSGVSAWTNGSALSTVRISEPGGFAAITPIDGTTLYAIWNNANWYFYTTADGAYAGGSSGQLLYSAAVTITASWQIWVSYIGSIGAITTNPNF